MKKVFPYLILIVISIAIYLTAFTQQTEEKYSMTVTELKQKMQNDSLVILDVRTEEELTGPLGHIEGVVHIPLQELKMRVNELDQYTGKEIAVICRSGNRSNTATGFLRQHGFNAYNVEGGMIDYRKNEGR